jgi:hypothetical protein
VITNYTKEAIIIELILWYRGLISLVRGGLGT